MSTWVDSQLQTSAIVKLGKKGVTSVANATGTETRTTFATGSVTLPQLAERVAALIVDLKAAGVIK